MGLFSGSIPLWFVLSHNIPTINTTTNWLCSGAFPSPPVPYHRIHWPLATGHWPLFPCHCSFAPRLMPHQPLTFWFKPDSILGLFLLTAFISTSPGLTCPGLLAPDRRDAGS